MSCVCLQEGWFNSVQGSHCHCALCQLLWWWTDPGHRIWWQNHQSVDSPQTEVSLLAQPAHQLGPLCQVWNTHIHLYLLLHCVVRFLVLSFKFNSSNKSNLYLNWNVTYYALLKLHFSHPFSVFTTQLLFKIFYAFLMFFQVFSRWPFDCVMQRW